MLVQGELPKIQVILECKAVSTGNHNCYRSVKHYLTLTSEVVNISKKNPSSILATPNKFVPQTAATRDAAIYQAITKTSAHSGCISFRRRIFV